MLISRQKSGSVLIKILLNCQLNHMPSVLGEQMFALALARCVKAPGRDRWLCLHHRVLPGSLQTETCIKCLLLYSRIKIYGLDMLETVLIWLHLETFSVGWWNLHSLCIKDVSALTMGKKQYGRSKLTRASSQEKKMVGNKTMVLSLSVLFLSVINRRMPLPINLTTSSICHWYTLRKILVLFKAFFFIVSSPFSRWHHLLSHLGSWNTWALRSTK